MIETKRLPNYDPTTNGLIIGNVMWETNEGASAAKEVTQHHSSLYSFYLPSLCSFHQAIAYLRALEPLPASHHSSGMVKAARRALAANKNHPDSISLLPQVCFEFANLVF